MFVVRILLRNSLNASPFQTSRKDERFTLPTFRERQGYAYSAEKAASVAFDIHLIRVSDGVTIWRGLFDETQKSLMENLFQIVPFFQGGGQWVTAKELATEGIDALMENFPLSE